MTSMRTPKHFIQSLARGLTVLQAFSAERPRLGLQQLAQVTGFNKTAVQRLTDTLMSLGFLGRNEYKEFYLEPKVLSLGFAYLNGSELRQLAETHLKGIRPERKPHGEPGGFGRHPGGDPLPPRGADLFQTSP